ncbi:MAG: quinone oxidoreductase [Myxococcota bacterium]
MSQAVRIHETGGPEVLRLETVDLPEPGPGQARVRHTAVGINYIDTYHRTGVYPLPSLPHGLGTEASGVVEALGSGVEDLAVGARVTYISGVPGTYAEHGLVPADRLVPIPDDVTDEVAAAALLKGMTVEYLVRRTYRVTKGETVLLHAAAGGVGLIACQWLREIGARVIGTVSTEEKAAIAEAHGCTHPIVYTQEDFVERVREITGGAGVPVVYDSVGASTFEKSLDCLEPRGLYVGFGNASGKPPPFDMGLLAQKGSLFLTRPTLFDYVRARRDLLASANHLFGLIGTGEIKIDVRQRWPLAEAAEAHRALESRQTVGASVLVP